MKYTVIYNGYLFYGDSDGENRHDFDRWDDVVSLINAYGDIIIVKYNDCGVVWKNGEWC